MQALVRLLAAVLLTAVAARAGEPVAFLNEELLHQPRHDGVTLALVPEELVLVMVEFGPGDEYVHSTLPRRVRAGELGAVRLDGLLPDTRYGYRVLVRRPGEVEWQARDAHAFHTLRSPGETVRFAVLPDPHAWAMWSKACAGGGVGSAQGWLVLLEALNAVAAEAASLDFAVLGTDNVMTTCAGCKACDVFDDPVGPQSASSALDAHLRYRSVFGPGIYGRFGADLPVLELLGDHDGEQGWGTLDLACGYGPDQLAWSTAARHAHVPHAGLSYPAAGPEGEYWALRTGDLLLVGLDVGRYTTEIPDGPESWTLGAQQLQWLERVLASSDATFKVVMAEHVLGGQSSGGPGACDELVHWKGRGTLTSTHDGTPAGTFLGEQALVQALLAEHDAQLFMSFHDHVVAFGEKLDGQAAGQGVHYLTAGQCAGKGPPAWSNEDWYRQAMDFDGDGIPEYLTNVTGTDAKGWWRVTVQGAEQLVLEFVLAAPGTPVNGEVALTFTLAP